MDHTEASLMKLLDYQGKVNSILDDLRNNFDEIKTTFTKLEAEIDFSKNVNSKLSDRLISVERKMSNIPEGNVWKF